MERVNTGCYLEREEASNVDKWTNKEWLGQTLPCEEVTVDEQNGNQQFIWRSGFGEVISCAKLTIDEQKEEQTIRKDMASRESGGEIKQESGGENEEQVER